MASTPTFPIAWIAMRKPRSTAATRVLVEIAEAHAEPHRGAADGRVERDGDAAVGEQLHRADAAPLVAVAGGWAVEPGAVVVREQRARMRHADDRDRERPARAIARVHGLGLGRRMRRRART